MPDNPKNLDHISRFLREHGKDHYAEELERELEKFTVKPKLASEVSVYELLAQDVLRRVRTRLSDALTRGSPGSVATVASMNMLELAETAAQVIEDSY